MRRVLFFAEAVTLAHLGRLISLAEPLDLGQFECTFACPPAYAHFLTKPQWRHESLDSISSAAFLRALERGTPVYDLATLRRYVREDLALIKRCKPDTIVGDFRLSLAVSARVARVPYAAIVNAYWSPYYARFGYPTPVLPHTRRLPLALAKLIFQMARPLAWPIHCRPMNLLRREHGLAPVGNDLRRVYTDADFVLYADDPLLFPAVNLPESHKYLGPVLWSPPVPEPSWWSRVPADRPIVYVTLGSSGDPRLLASTLDALSRLKVRVIAASAGADVSAKVPSNAFVADYLPGIAAAERSSVVVCNGGSSTCQQALVAGVPVVGIAGNMDQFMNMAAWVEAGAGLLLRADRCSPRSVSGALERALTDPSMRQAARTLQARTRTGYGTRCLESVLRG